MKQLVNKEKPHSTVRAEFNQRQCSRDEGTTVQHTKLFEVGLRALPRPLLFDPSDDDVDSLH